MKLRKIFMILIVVFGLFSLNTTQNNAQEVPEKREVGIVAEITATDFTITVDEAHNLTKDQANAYGNAILCNYFDYTCVTGLDVYADQLEAIHNVTGPTQLPLTFYDESGLYKAVTVTIIEHSEYTIEAHDITITKDQAYNAWGMDIASWSDAKAYDKEHVYDSSKTALIDVNQMDVLEINMANPGKYDATLYIPETSARTTIEVTILGDTPVVPEVHIDAHDFSINTKDLPSLTDAIAMTNAGVNAYNDDNTSLNDKVSVDATELAAIKATNENKVLPLTFTVSDNGKTASKTINVTIVKDYSVNIDAHDFSINVNDLSTLDDQAAIKLSNASATDQDNNNIDSLITVDATQLASIKAATDNAVMPLTFSVTQNDKTASKTINVTIVKNYSVSITANNFSIDVNDVASLNEQQAITLASASATNQDAQDITSLVSVDRDELNAIKATTDNAVMPLTFSVTQNGKIAVITINVTVIKNYSVSIDASDFSINVNDLGSLDDQAAKVLANVVATNQDNQDINGLVSVDVNELNVIKAATDNAVLPLTFSVSENGNTATKTINVTVIKDNPEIIPDTDTAVDPSKPIEISDPTSEKNNEVDAESKVPSAISDGEENNQEYDKPQSLALGALQSGVILLPIIAIALIGLVIMKKFN